MVEFYCELEERLKRKFGGNFISIDDVIAYISNIGGKNMEWVNFKVKEGERERIKKDAYRHEMNISEYLRWLIDKQRKEDEGK